MYLNNIFSSIPDELDNEVIESLLENESIKIERIVSKGQSSPQSGWYDQQFNEWVIVLQGEAVILFENDREVRLKNGDYLNIPAHNKHKVSWTDPQVETIWLAIHY